MTRHERRRRAIRQQQTQGAVLLGMAAFMAVTCTGLSRGAMADDEIKKVPRSGAENTSYIVEVEQNASMALTYYTAAEAVEAEPEKPYTEADVIALAQMAYGEAFITQSDTEISACMWCACNRLDSGNHFYAMTKQEIEAAYQYQWRQNQLEDALRQLNTLVFGYDDGAEFNDPEDDESRICFEEDFGIGYDEASSAQMLERYLAQFDCRFDCNVDENSQWEAAIKTVLRGRKRRHQMLRRYT